MELSINSAEILRKTTYLNTKYDLQTIIFKIRMHKNPESFIRQVIEFQCPICLEVYDEEQKFPMMICPSQHSCCLSCLNGQLFQGKNKGENIDCPFCKSKISKEMAQKFRLLNQIRITAKNLRVEGSCIRRGMKELGEKNETLLNQLKKQRQKNEWLIQQQQQRQQVKNLLSQNKVIRLEELLKRAQNQIHAKNYQINRLKLELEKYNYQRKPLATQNTPQRVRRVQSNQKQLKIPLSGEKYQIENQIFPHLIHFKEDKTNERIKVFKITENPKRAQMIGGFQDIILNHCETIPKRGIFYFKIKIVNSFDKHIMLGICGKNIKTAINSDAYYSPFFMGLNLHHCHLFGNNTKLKINLSKLNIVNGESIFKVEINMNKRIIRWFMDNKIIYECQISKSLGNSDFYPMVTLNTKGDIVQFLDK